MRVNQFGSPITVGRGFTAVDGAADTNPMQSGGAAALPTDATATQTVSANGDVQNFVVTRDGVQYVLPYAQQIWRLATEFSMTGGSTDVQLKAAAATGLC